MRVVLDTNIWLSGLLYSTAASPPRKILEHFSQGDFELVTSPELVEEFDEVMRRHRLPQITVNKWIEVFERTHLSIPPFVHHVEPTDLIDAISADPDDNRIFECAVAGQADCIVSGDKHLLKLSSYQNIPILSPRYFILKLNSEE